ncbi:MAG: type IV secretory system conjugative DNA transfer family protein [Syntrophothermus sp.]|uniref:type IV secretory system conjugative DNA transfer family protein n=1 Tax=Syntrophothermus sp. TaxID=2736299 RepID=UPI00257DEC97|nr:type IV secretory system conjugative DNA transfer family protein [Syntrophothermus sp.]NSW83628.1 type IV secretory system conjugative DNA transfer family protein [Syntrophothermus sp.]
MLFFKKAELPKEAQAKRAERPSVIVAYDLKGDPIVLEGEDRFLHMIIIGPTGTGKSSRMIKPMVYQDLEKIAAGVPMSLTLIEPKGSLAREVAAIARKMGIKQVTLIDPEDPETAKFNPLQGSAHDVAESTRTVLRATFGKQDAFFAQAQETHSRNAVLLLKALRGDQLTMMDLARVLRDQEALKNCVIDLKNMGGDEDLIYYFEKEVFGELKNKFHQFAMGLRLQLEDLMGNQLLRNVFQGNSSVLMPDHLETPGSVLIVNTSMGALKKLGDTFGQFVIMHLQNAVFSRPGNEFTRQTHVLYIDEFPRYVNPDFERSLAVGREFRNAVVMAAQGTDQMILTEKATFRNIVLNCARNHVVFGDLIYDDAKLFADMFGKVEKQTAEVTYDDSPYEVIPWINKKVRVNRKEVHRFPPTYIMDISKKGGKNRVLVRICRGGVAMFPQEAEVYRLDELGIDPGAEKKENKIADIFKRLLKKKEQPEPQEEAKGEAVAKAEEEKEPDHRPLTVPRLKAEQPEQEEQGEEPQEDLAVLEEEPQPEPPVQEEREPSPAEPVAAGQPDSRTPKELQEETSEEKPPEEAQTGETAEKGNAPDEKEPNYLATDSFFAGIKL